MEKVAASKLRRTQARMNAARPYADKIRQVVGNLFQANPEYRHPFLEERPVKRVGYIVMSTDKGLCGGLNVNEFRRLLGELRRHEAEGVEADLCLIGAKSVQYFRRLKVNVVAATTNLGENPHVASLIGAITVMLDAYREGKIDRLYLVYNDFINTMSQKVDIQQLLPVEAVDASELSQTWDYIYEPGASELLNDVLTRYIETQVYRGIVENVACEMASKMVAMKAATDNAGKLIGNLQLEYNKARQASITQEISEIVGGAAAVSG
jgi:F-type H+-transporting ATPase subunit gamma